MGADVTNNSWGGGGFNGALENAIFQAGQAGQVFVAAAGNGGPGQVGDDNDVGPHYPSNYTLTDVISVAATDRHDNITGFSNFGAVSVDFGAPGSAIRSTTPGDTYSVFSGTSMAAPHVTGVVALLLASEPGLTPEEVRARILDGADPIAALDGITVSGGRLNAANTLATPQPGSILGTVWNDADNDGVEDAGETGLAGVTVYLDANANGGLDSGEVTVTTNGSGNYTFANVAAGTHQVGQVAPSGFTQTSPVFVGSYAWADTNTTGGPAYNWFDISSVGTLLSMGDGYLRRCPSALCFRFLRAIGNKCYDRVERLSDLRRGWWRFQQRWDTQRNRPGRDHCALLG
jgi:subtilisin family serine protease